MKKLWCAAVLALGATIVPAAVVHGVSADDTPINGMCPIGKEPIVPSAGTIEYKGQTIGLCCPGCGKAFLGWEEGRRDEFVALAMRGEEPGQARRAASATAPSRPVFSVEQVGQMKAVLRDGMTEPRVRLVDVVDRPGVVAVGALAGLDGEITIVGGEVWVSRVDGDGISTSGPDVAEDDWATLLAVATVDTWDVFELDAQGEAIDEVIESHANAAGLSIEEPIPFVITPARADIEVHVINGYCPHGEPTPDGGGEPWRWSSDSQPGVTIVGIYARDRAGDMTHHGEAIHAHAILNVDGRSVTGHIDRAFLSGRVNLRLPGAGGEPAESSGTTASLATYPYPLPDCPVGGPLGSMGDPVIKVYDDREVRFCCAGCIDTFEEDKDEYWKAIDAKIVEAQLMHYPIDSCIVAGGKLGSMGDPVNLVYNNRLIRFCCAGCEPGFKDDPAKYFSALDKKIIEQQTKGYPLTTCVVAGAELGSMGDPVDYIFGNRLVRFCCASCIKPFEREPAKYMARIDKAYADAQRASYPLDICVVAGAELGSMGDPVELVAGTQLVRFCCAACFPAFKKDPHRYLAELTARP